METREFYIAGVQFHDMKKVISALEEGTELDLTPEPDNQYDPNAVRIEHKETMLGYVPRKLSSEVSAALEIETDLECIITKLTPTAKPWEQCKVRIQEKEV